MRLYSIVMGNLSGRQQGIQMGHAALEYVSKFKDRQEVWEFIKYYKTFICLSGGGSMDMIQHMEDLILLGIDYASFVEPDLNNSVSAIAFLIPREIYELDVNSLTVDPYSWEYQVKAYLNTFKLASN